MRIMVSVLIRRPARCTLIFLTSVIPCDDKLSNISSSEVSARSLHRMTPFLEFILQCGTTCNGQFASILERNRFSEWLLFETSIMRSPDRSLFTDVGVPAKPFKPFSMAKGLSFARGESCLCPVLLKI